MDAKGEPVLDSDGKMIYDPAGPVYHDPSTGKVVYQEYLKEKRVRTAYMYVLSFPGVNELGYQLDPRLVMSIGKEWCKEFLPDFPVVIAEHVNTDHYHLHMVASAYSSPEFGPSHKIRDNMENLKRAREIADELSMKIGIPIIVNPKTRKGMEWYEWTKRRQSDSWKQTLRQDVRDAASLSGSIGEFKKIMEQSGYTIRETEHHFTFRMPCASGEDRMEYRCRDSKLNIVDDPFGYEKEQIMAFIRERTKDLQKTYEVRDPMAAAREMETARQKRAAETKISRYTIDGRRRSVLELILLNAIRLIKLFLDDFQDVEVKTNSPVYQKAEWKLRQMQDSLQLIRSLGIENREELDQLVNQTGIRLSQLKKQFETLSGSIAGERKTLQKIEDAIRLLEYAKATDFPLESFGIYSYTNREIRAAKALMNPSTPQQRRELFLQLEKNQMYRLEGKFDQLTFREADQCINFLRGKTAIKPDCMVSMMEEMDHMLAAKRGDRLPEREDVPRDGKPKNTVESQKMREEKDRKFMEAILSLPLDQAEKLSDLRELLNELGKLDVDISNLVEKKQEMMDSIDAFHETEEELACVKNEYRNLKRLSYNLSLAENPKFTCGPLYTEKPEDPEYTEERDRSAEEDRRVTIRDRNAFRVRDRYFESMESL